MELLLLAELLHELLARNDGIGHEGLAFGGDGVVVVELLAQYATQVASGAEVGSSVTCMEKSLAYAIDKLHILKG